MKKRKLKKNMKITKEYAAKILVALSEGKVIEKKEREIWEPTEWTKDTEISEIMKAFENEDIEFRVAPEPVYKPYSSKDQFLKDFESCGPYVSHKSKKKGDGCFLVNGFYKGEKFVKTETVEIYYVSVACVNTSIASDKFLKDFIWSKTGKPCGIEAYE